VVANENKYWFPAKSFGWGWGLPTAWQGWVVYALFLILVLVGAVAIRPSYGSPIFFGYTGLITLLLVAVCWAKGERPQWRWSKE
jgi:hypothetical protein